MAGLHVGDCVLRRGELHTVVAIDSSLSPNAYMVQNHTTGAVVNTELSFLSLPEHGPEPDTSVQSIAAATLSTSDRNTEATTTTAELHAVDEALSAARIQRRLLLQRQLQHTVTTQPLGIPAALKMLRLVEEATLNAIATQSKIEGGPLRQRSRSECVVRFCREHHQPCRSR